MRNIIINISSSSSGGGGGGGGDDNNNGKVRGTAVPVNAKDTYEGAEIQSHSCLT